MKLNNRIVAFLMTALMVWNSVGAPLSTAYLDYGVFGGPVVAAAQEAAEPGDDEDAATVGQASQGALPTQDDESANRSRVVEKTGDATTGATDDHDAADEPAGADTVETYTGGGTTPDPDSEDEAETPAKEEAAEPVDDGKTETYTDETATSGSDDKGKTEVPANEDATTKPTDDGVAEKPNDEGVVEEPADDEDEDVLVVEDADDESVPAGRVMLTVQSDNEQEATHTVTYDANGGTFSNGESTNTVVYGTKSVERYSHTPNVSDAGVKNGIYANSYAQNEVVTIDGADKLEVTIVYGGESASYDWVCAWDGNHPEYTASNNHGTSFTGKLGGGSHTAASNTKTYTRDGDTVTFAFRTDGSGCGDGYGYYAVVRGLMADGRYVSINTASEGTYKTPRIDGGSFEGWYLDQACTQPFNPYWDVPAESDATVYAKYASTTNPVARVCQNHSLSWSYFESLDEAITYANTLGGIVDVELLTDSFVLPAGLAIDGTITSLSLRAADEVYGTCELLKAQGDTPMFTVGSGVASLSVGGLRFNGGGEAMQTAANGGIFSIQGLHAAFEDCTFTDCFVKDDQSKAPSSGADAKSNGAAIAHYNAASVSGTLTIQNCHFSNCMASSYSGGDTGNQALGGAVFFRRVGGASQLHIDQTSFEDCASSRHAGAVFVQGASGTVDIIGSSFTGCTARLGGGGAVYSEATLPLTITDSSFATCRAAKRGGAVYAAGAVNLVTTRPDASVSFDDCATGNNAGVSASSDTADGGAVYASGVLSMDNNVGTIAFVNCGTTGSNNEGGAIYSNNNVTAQNNAGAIRFNDCHTTGNTSEGGAIFSTATITLTNVGEGSLEFEGCHANASDGGGAVNGWSNRGITIAGTEAHPVTFANCQANNCNANRGGGAIYANGGAINLTYCNITGCTANKGAAVYATGALTLNNCVVTGNDATTEGTVQANGSGRVHFKGSTKVYGNTFKGAEGHNVYLGLDDAGRLYADGLADDADIHVFVTDAIKGKRGYAGRMFGVYTDESNLDRIVNERFNDSHGQPLRATTSTTYEGDKRMAWQGEDVVVTLVSSVDGTTPVEGARFELRRSGWDSNTVIWRGTTDKNGQLTIPWTGHEDKDRVNGDEDGGAANFINGRQYELKQLQASDDFALPGGRWIIAINAANGLTSETKQLAKTNHTYPLEISGTHLERNAWRTQNDPSTLKVTYDLNATEASVSFVDENGVSLPNPQSVGFSKDVDVADDSAYAQIPTQEGHHFVGWNTKADGTGAAFAPGSTLYHCDGESNGEMTLYAQWEESEHVARISRDGGKTWTYYGALITGEYDGATVDGAFDAANTGSGNVIIETLYAEHDRYALTKCFTFSRAADITIRANPKLAGKSRIVKAQATDPVIIYNGYRKTFTLQDLTFDGQNNPTTSGRGGIIRRGGSNGPYGLTITDCDFINACTSGDNGQGGAIAWEQAVTINHTTGDAMRFENCHASKAGGAIYTSGAFTVNLNNTGNGDVVFSECSSGTTGGALYVGDNDSATLRINNSGKGTISFANCTTTSGAGGAVGCGIFVADSNRGTIRFKDCEAITTGGAINCTSTSNSTYSNMNSNDGTIVFDSCHAQGNGGAIAYQRLFQAVGNAGKITFSDCQSGGNGGAVAGAHNSSTRKLEFRNTVGGTLSFVDCTAATNGGALYTNNYEVAVAGVSASKPVSFVNCRATGGSGGAIYGGGMNLTHVAFGAEDDAAKACTASANGGAVYAGGAATLSDVKVYEASAANGGAWYFNYGANRITNCVVANCSATGGSGGAVFFNNGANYLTDCTVTGCTATADGGAVHLAAATSLTFDGGRYTDNSASGTVGGAVSATNNSSSTHLYFQGDVYVYDNPSSNGEQRNVVLSIPDRNSVIYTTNVGLGTNAKVGIYVTGTTTSNPYMNHGQADKVFGTQGGGAGGAANLSKFINDRNTKLKGDADSGTGIVWGGDGVCKLTDNNDNLLYKTQHGAPAVYGTIRAGLSAAGGTLYYKDGDDYKTFGSAEAIKLKLLADVVLTDQDVPTYSGSRELTMTTAELPGDNTDSFAYVRKGEDSYADLRTSEWASIKRARTGSPLITINTAAGVRVENLLFDGDNVNYTGNGGCFSVTRISHLDVKDVVFENFKAREGGAIYGSVDLKVNVKDDGVFRVLNCTASTEGAAIRLYSRALTINNEGTIDISGCTASTAGGAISTNSGSPTTIINEGSITFDNCADTVNDYGGGAIYTGALTAKGNGTMRFTGCSSAGYGGALACAGNTTIENATFSDCSAKGTGGALYSPANITISNTTQNEVGFYNCSSASEGGAIYAANRNSNTLTINNEKGGIVFSNCEAGADGGAISVQEKTATINNKGAIVFDHCESGQDGGGICTDGYVLHINNSEDASILFDTCKALKKSSGTATGGGMQATPSFGTEGNKGTLTFENCSADEAGGGVYANNAVDLSSAASGAIRFAGCTAGTNGGGVYAVNDCTMGGVQLTKCAAAGNGGGLCGAGNVTLRDGTQFSGCSTTSTTGKGAALYLATSGKSANFHGGTEDGVNGVKITGCRTVAPQGGAVDCVSGAKLNFEGNVYILNNRLEGSTDQRNVVLAHDNQTTINTTAQGLGEDASIGVYVTDERMEKRGKKERDFGTYASNSNLDAFMNDRLPLVGGEDANKAIAWSTAYTLVLDPNGGDGAAISVRLTTLKEYTLGAPFTKDGYHFTGWNTRKDGTGDSFASSDVVSKLTDEDGATVTLYAQWDDYDACGIFFHPNGGTEVPSREVKPGTELGLLPSSMREHYTFVRWMLMKDGVEESYSQTMPVETDLHFYALWQKKVAITFDAQGGIVGEEVREMAPGKIGTLPKTEQPAASKRDYEFVRWYALDKDGNRYTVTADTEFTADATVYAEWRVTPRRLRYNTNGGYPGYDPSTNTHWFDSDYITDLDTIKSYVVQNLPPVTNHGYELDGWYVGSTRISNGSELIDGVTLDLSTQNVATAHWNKLEWVTVTFNSDGGSSCNSISVYKGDKADHYPEPTKSGYAFAGWYLLDEAGLFAKDDDGQDIEVNVLTTLNDDITVKAKWESYATVSFDSDGGSACEPISVQKGNRIKSYPTPTKDGCVFAGWYTSDGVEVNDQTTIDEDVAVRAKWNEIATVTFNWTDRKDADGNPVVTTDTVEQGKTLSMIPGTYREGYVLDGWYPDAEFTGEALTASTVIDDDVTYYAKWRLSKIEKDEPVEYEFDVKWTDASTSELTNLNDCLTWYVAGSTSKTVEAHAYVGFALKETEGKVFQPGTIKIRVPKYVFVDWNGNSIRGTNDIVAYIPKAPAKSKTFRWNYVDEGDYYVIQNTEATENVTFDLRITYTADIKNVKAARISSQTGQHLDSQGNVLENDDYAPRNNTYSVTIDSDDVNMTETKDLATAAYKTYAQTTYTADFSRGSASVKRSWDNAWGTKPDDADDYYYVVWTHGGFAVNAHGDIKGSASGKFETTSKEWVDDAYEVVYTDSANNYVVTRHPYAELTNNRKTLYKKEVVKGRWTSSGLEETGKGTIPCEIDFRVYEPYTPSHPSETVTSLSASKSYGAWWSYRGFKTGQDSLLDDEPLTTSFSLSMYGPGKDNLVQKGDTSLYYANDYTMVVRDGAPGDVTYYSQRANRRVRLGDNDYNVTRLSISLSNSDGYKDESGWHSLANTAYSSWKPVEVWLRRKGEVEYYKYTDVYITSGSAKTVVLPSDTVGFEVRHSTFYWRTHLSVSPTMRINATAHVKNLVQPDYSARVTTSFYNKASFRAVANDDGTTLLSTTKEDFFSCGKSKTGLRVSKSVGTATYDNVNSIQTVPVTVTGFHYNDSGRNKPIHAGVFYELLPLDTTVDESSVSVRAGSTLLDRSMVNVEYVSDWLDSGQTMMITSVGMPESMRSSSVSLNYTLTNSYENIIARGTSAYSPSAFANTSTNKEVYEVLPKVKRINEIVDGQKVFGEQEQQYGEYVAYGSSNIKFKDINVSSSGFFKAVNTLNEYEEDAEIIAQTPYTYRLVYGQSSYAQSDGIVMYDLIDRGTVAATTSKFYGVTSAWQGTLQDIRVPEVTSEGATCKPVVYYSTTDVQDIKDLPRDLSDTSVWSTTKPSDPVTAVAIDCSKDVNGNDFVLIGDDNIVVYLSMMSPANEALNGKTAVNTAASSSRISSIGEVAEQRDLEYQTTVTMKPVEPEVTITSTPESGTVEEPKLMAYKDTLTYDISVTNPDEVFDYRNIRLEDVLPEGLTPEKGNILVYVGDDPSTGVKIATSTRASLLLEGDPSKHLAFAIGELLPKETLHIVIPCVVDTREGKIDNEATLTQASGLSKDVHTTTTHHEVRQYDVLFGKKKLGVEPEEFLAGAHLELLDASGSVVSSWMSSDASGDEYHAVRIGAGEYTLQESDAPRDYAIADPVMFTLSREGVVTIRKQEDPLPDRVVDMFDKYIAVDAVIQNHVSGEDADPNKEFVYTVALTGLKPNETYDAGSKTITADRLGNATIELTLRGDEQVTLSKLPTGAEVVVTQAGSEYATSYTAKVAKDGEETLLHSGETNVSDQDLVTQSTKLDIDQGTLHFDFQNVMNANTVPVRFVVLDAQDNTPVPGSSFRIDGPEPDEGEERFTSEWVSTKEHKRVDLPKDAPYSLTQLGAPEGYTPADGELTVVVDKDGNVSCSDPEAITQDEHGYVVTIKNVRQAHVSVENMNVATNFFLAGAKLELLKGDDLDTAKRVEAWTSSDESGKDLYLEADADYFVRKTSSPDGCAPVDPTVVKVHVDANRTVTVDPTSSYASKTETITLWDRYVETLAITNKVTGADPGKEFPYVVSGLTKGDTYSYVRTDVEGKDVEGTLSVNEDGQVVFGLKPGDTIVIRDLPHSIELTETKPEGHYYNTEWVQDETEVLEAKDTQQGSTVSVTLNGRNAIVVTNKECVARVRNKTADGEWSDWTYFEYLATDTNDGAFDYANGLSGDVEVETLWETHDRYNMSQGFEFTNSDITSLAIRSTDDLTKAGKHTTIVGSSASSLLTFNTKNPVEVDDLEFDGNKHAQTSDGGAISVTSGSLTLSNASIHDFVTQGRGGAVFVGTNAELTINEGTSLTNCSATNGGAIYAVHEDDQSAALVINGGTITNNTTLQEGHAAVEAGSMQFNGTVKIMENINSAIDGAANVLLDKDSNEVIRSMRLEEGSQIGVYVSDAQDDAHGGSGDPFGTYTVDQNLDVLINDKNGLYAEAADDPTSRRIIWHPNETNLTITNTVTGDYADRTRPFTITLTSTALAGQTVQREGSDDPVVFDDKGVATLTLAHGEQATLLGLPDGTDVSVVTEEVASYSASYVVTQGDVTSDDAHNLKLKAGADTKVDITNAFDGVPATGLVQNVAAWGCLVAVSALGIAGSWVYRRRWR